MDPPQKRRKLAPKVPQTTSPSQAIVQNLPTVPSSTVVENGALPARNEFERFARHLQDAAMLIQRSAERPHYKTARAIILQWDGDEASKIDASELYTVFREDFHFETHRLVIPATSTASTRLGVEFSKLTADAPDSLLVVCYVGYGYCNSKNEVYWARDATPTSPKVKWNGLRCVLDSATCDVLYLLNCCAVAPPAPKEGSHVQQVIAGLSSTEPASIGPPRALSHYLIQSLRAFCHLKATFSVQALFEDVVSRQRATWSTPIARGPMPNDYLTAINFTLCTGKWPSISLTPRPVDGFPPVSSLEQLTVPQPDPDQPRAITGGSGVASITPQVVMDLKFDEPRVLACTTFVGEASTDMTFFNTWLEEYPSIADKVAVEAMFFGPPTMLLISMAMPIWEIVRHDKVCIFLGYIGSHNFVHLYQNLIGYTGSRRIDGKAKEAEDGRILLEAREAARQRSSEELLPADGFHKSADTTMDLSYSKDDVEESAEMKEAAEQLKALSHTRHPMTEPASIQGRRRSTLPSSAPFTREDGAEEEVSVEEVAEASNKPKATRRSNPKAPLRNETRCTMCTHAPFKDTSSLRKHIAAAHTRPFPCAFSFAGCLSTFGSKNEWKRHIASQHLCLQFYRCSACPNSASEGKFNEFNRKDLFTQHLRRMHAPFAIKKNAGKADARLQSDWETTVKTMQKSCLVQRRLPPQKSACPKAGCFSVFEGPTSWDEWTEHVGRHMEKGEAQGLGFDSNLADWALEEGIVGREAESGEYKLTPDSTYAGRHHDHHHQPITQGNVSPGQAKAGPSSTPSTNRVTVPSTTGTPGDEVTASSPSDQKRKRTDWRRNSTSRAGTGGRMEVDGDE